MDFGSPLGHSEISPKIKNNVFLADNRNIVKRDIICFKGEIYGEYVSKDKRMFLEKSGRKSDILGPLDVTFSKESTYKSE